MCQVILFFLAASFPLTRPWTRPFWLCGVPTAIYWIRYSWNYTPQRHGWFCWASMGRWSLIWFCDFWSCGLVYWLLPKESSIREGWKRGLFKFYHYRSLFTHLLLLITQPIMSFLALIHFIILYLLRTVYTARLLYQNGLRTFFPAFGRCFSLVFRSVYRILPVPFSSLSTLDSKSHSWTVSTISSYQSCTILPGRIALRYRLSSFLIGGVLACGVTQWSSRSRRGAVWGGRESVGGGFVTVSVGWKVRRWVVGTFAMGWRRVMCRVVMRSFMVRGVQC